MGSRWLLGKEAIFTSTPLRTKGGDEMSIELIEAIGMFIVTPIAAVAGMWVFFYYITKD